MRRGRRDPAVEVRFRLTVLQRLMPMSGGLIGIAVAPPVIWATGGGFDLGAWVHVIPQSLAGFIGGGLFAALFVSRGFGIVLTPSAAEVHNLRQRTIRWSEIQAIQIEPFLGSRTVVLYEISGRRTRLRAPITGFLAWDRQFEEKFHTIGRWWLAHRAIDQAPVIDLGPRGQHWA
jgi:hypothetical protein